MQLLKFLSLGSFLSIAFLGYGMADSDVDRPCKMPNEDTFREYLLALERGYFAEKTGIIKSLAGKELMGIGVANVVARACLDYSDHVKRSVPAGNAQTIITKMENGQANLLEFLLKGRPEVLQDLEKNGIYKPIGKK